MRSCCDEDGACCTKTRRCRYHCPCPPLLLDTIYHRFREPCLAIICVLIIIAFGTSSVYELKPLTCDKMYIVDPTCDQIPHQRDGVNFTQTHLISQNNVFYEGESWNKYNFAHQIDTWSTFILLVGNSPYHSPVWLVIGFMGSMYSTYIYTDSIEYCSGDYCKTNENDRIDIPDECYQPIIYDLLIDEEQIEVCQMDTDTYSLCTYCQCLSHGIDSCKQYMDRGLFDRLHVLMSYFWFILIYLRQIVVIIVMIKIMYKKCFGKMHEEESLLQLELIQNMNINNNNQPNIVQQDDSKNEETLTGNAGLIEMETINDNELMVADTKNTNRNICMFLSKMYKVFTDPLSVRLTAASCIAIIMLIVICQIVDGISNKYVAWCTLILPGDDHTFFISLIMSLLRIAGTICIFVYLRSVWIMHHQFSSDVAAVYAYYDDVDQNDDDIVVDNNGDDNVHNGDNADNKILTKLKSLIVKLFPVNIRSGPHIVDHVKKCRIMNAYLFMFMYPVSIMSGWIILFITMAIPIMLVATIIVISWIYSFGAVLEFIWSHFEDIWKMVFVPLLGIIIFDRCILRGNTHQILTQRKVNCLWCITLVDIASTMAAALFITLWNIFVVRMVYSMGIFCYGLMSPYKSAFPTPFEKYDKVYQTYCANVALAALALLKSTENKASATDN